MPFITQGKTNWKFLLIIIILSIIVAGGALWLSTKQKVSPVEFSVIKKEEKFEEITKQPTIAGLIGDQKINGAKRMYVLGNYAYIAGETGLIIVDISKPETPVIIVSVSDKRLEEGDDVFVLNNYVYLVKSATLTIVDVSNPASPSIVGFLTDGNLRGISGINQGIYVVGKYAYIVSGYSRIFTVVDISNPRNPIKVSSVLVGDPKILSEPSRIYISGQYAYISSWGANAKSIIVDISNPTEPKVIGRINGPNWANDIYVSEKYAYVIGSETWTDYVLYVFDISDPLVPIKVGSLQDKKLDAASGIYVLGKYAFVAGRIGLLVIDISNPKEPKIIASVFESDTLRAEDLFVSNRYVYLLTSNLVTIDLKGEIVRSSKQPISVQILPGEILQVEEKPLGEKEREVAFFQDGDIWVLSKDLKTKYKIIDTKEEVIDFYISPDGKEMYWLNGQEIWKRDSNGNIKLLVKASKFNVEELKKRWKDIGWVNQEDLDKLKGGIVGFEPSPDGKYIAYQEIEDYSGCCAGPPTTPMTWTYIMKNDGTEKVKIERPSSEIISERQIYFEGWLPDSKKIIFSSGYLDEPFGFPPLFEIGVDGKNPKEYYLSNLDNPIFSPSGEKMAYVEGGIFGEGKVWLANIDGTEKIMLLQKEEAMYVREILKWSEDGSLLTVMVDKLYIFDKKGNIVFETDAIADPILSSDNRYLVVRGAQGFIVINLLNKERKEFKLPEIEGLPFPWTNSISLQFFSQNNRLYYFVSLYCPEDLKPLVEELETRKLFPQLWLLDLNNWKSYKVSDNISQVKTINY